jgi:hypothetical protein
VCRNFDSPAETGGSDEPPRASRSPCWNRGPQGEGNGLVLRIRAKRAEVERYLRAVGARRRPIIVSGDHGYSSPTSGCFSLLSIG